ncbi:TPA: hypothetical protein SLN52_003875 [Serratia marcescens]|nr:hypothetical protein [Serratia marcescens]
MKNIVENQGIKTDKPLAMSYEALKAERDALADRVNALAVENQALSAALSLISGSYGLSPHIQSMCAVDTPTTDSALAAIEARPLPANIAEIIDSGDLEAICFHSSFADRERIRMALYEFRQMREAK